MPVAPLGTTASSDERWGYPVRLIEQQSLVEVTGGDGRPAAAADLAFARFEHDYSSAMLDAVHEQGVRMREATTSPDRPRFLGLDHLRRVQQSIPEVGELVRDEKRLAALSELAGVELETYPIGTSCSGINFYRPGQPTIEFHRDGPAFVELVPLYVDGQQEGGSTVVFRGPPEVGQQRLRGGATLSADELLAIPQRMGCSVLMQGRMLLHTAEALTDGNRVTLVMSLRSAAEPWKDTNTLSRLLNDDRPEDVEDDWRRDVDERQLPALRRHLLS
jgi:hypothetical protein